MERYSKTDILKNVILDQNHTHFILVKNESKIQKEQNRFGGELEFRSLLEKELSKRNYCMLENIYFFETNSQYFNLILN